MAKRVLIITYYWPPLGGSGVQRWVKFAKYLRDFDWEPVIFTPENPDFELKDRTLLDEIDSQVEVLRFPIWEPYDLFRKMKNSGESPARILEKKNKSCRDKLGIWLRANTLIPDPRIFWKKPAVRYLLDLIDKEHYDAVITTGPPHSIHLIGLEIKKKTKLVWLADFRDPWSTWEFLDTLPMMNWVKNRHKRLEQQVLSNADVVTTISPSFSLDLESIGKRKVELLTNGYDPADLPSFWNMSSTTPEVIEILYTGVIDAIRDPIPFLNAFKEAFDTTSKKACLRFVGLVSETVKESVRKDDWLAKHVRFEGYMSHQEVFRFYQKAHLLLLILTNTKNAKGNIPGKLFEYIATGRPIIALGDPDGDASEILEKAAAGSVFRHEDHQGMVAFLSDFQPKIGDIASEFIMQFSRKKLTEKLARFLDEKTRSIP